MDELKIPGFGTHLARFLYPLPKPNDEDDKTIYPAIEEIFVCGIQDYSSWLNSMAVYALDPLEGNTSEWLDNNFFGYLDMLSLIHVIRSHKPKRYLEIGSGITTQVARTSARLENHTLLIECIDPCPRVDIENIADRVIQEPFGRNHLEYIKALEPGDVLFFDGSHVCLPDGDVTIFFMEVLPLVPKGVYVHIHDIFLPWDYHRAMKTQLWSEQYLLGQFLIGGAAGYRIVFPGAYMSKQDEALKLLRQFDSHQATGDLRFPDTHRRNGSFWMMRDTQG